MKPISAPVYLMISLSALPLLASAAFASGSPVVNCDVDNQNYSVSFTLGRTDEDLGDVLNASSQNDSFSFITEDDEPSLNQSILVGPRSGPDGVGDDTAIAKLAVPKYAMGGLSQIQLADKTEIDTFVVLADTNVTGDPAGKNKGYALRLEASNKANPKGAMKGLMTLVTRATDANIKQVLNLTSVPVTCIAGWE